MTTDPQLADQLDTLTAQQRTAQAATATATPDGVHLRRGVGPADELLAVQPDRQQRLARDVLQAATALDGCAPAGYGVRSWDWSANCTCTWRRISPRTPLIRPAARWAVPSMV